MAVMKMSEAKPMLVALGFDKAQHRFVKSVTGFQAGWNLGDELRKDGVFDQATSDALKLSYARLKAGKPTMSAHFSFSEFQCKCKGKFDDCRRIWVLRAHVRRLELYRNEIQGPVTITSGCRCTQYNAGVGGKEHSQHLYGAASDIKGKRTVEQKQKAAIFAGLGFKQSNNKVIHVDSRDKSGHNPNNRTPKHPAIWKYAS